MRTLTIASASMAMAVVLATGASTANAATSTCDGFTTKIRDAKVVRGGPRSDVLIGGLRSQRIFGGGGDDHICAGDGNDIVHGGSGNDTIHGGGRGDTLFGGGGSDHLYGDVLDDRLIGERGADSLIGGHGVDRMFGGPGNDLLRGGVNRDCYDGGGGVNTASFATATPPGPASAIPGVRVDLTQPSSAPGCRGAGMAQGDGNFRTDAEPLRNIQFIVGSAFADQLRGRPGTGTDARLGDDVCSGFAQTAGCGGGDEKPAGAFADVFEPAAPGPPDPGLIVRAGDGVAGETIDVSGAGPGAGLKVVGEPLVTGQRCGGGTCASPSGPLGYVLVYGGDGSDTVSIGDGLPPDMTVDVNGGSGDDTLNGSSLGEVLLGGDFLGADTLNGNGGDDALISEGGSPAAGPDVLSGGPGDDQLAADYPCGGDTFSGGPGDDVAGFAPSAVGIRATLSGTATLGNGTCPGGTPTRIPTDSEVLEGTNESDRLIGSNGPDTIWGREGNDTLIGRRGADDLEGFAGRDFIDARDGQRDRLIDCGSGRDRATTDRVDPRPIKC
jgi:Ca2+-binding RTX toxin-like protein